jgi:hypothetical protein
MAVVEVVEVVEVAELEVPPLHQSCVRRRHAPFDRSPHIALLLVQCRWSVAPYVVAGPSLLVLRVLLRLRCLLEA